MRRKRRNRTHTSDDLLLDTLCNTLGGVLFIALLVTVMVSLMDPTPDVDIPKPIFTQDELDSLSASPDDISAAMTQIDAQLVAYKATNLQLLRTQSSVQELRERRRTLLTVIPEPPTRILETAPVHPHGQTMYILCTESGLYSGILTSSAPPVRTQWQAHRSLTSVPLGAYKSQIRPSGKPNTPTQIKEWIQSASPTTTIAILVEEVPEGIQAYLSIKAILTHHVVSNLIYFDLYPSSEVYPILTSS